MIVSRSCCFDGHFVMVSRLCDDGVQGRDGRCVENSSCFQIYFFVPVCILLLGSPAGLIFQVFAILYCIVNHIKSANKNSTQHGSQTNPRDFYLGRSSQVHSKCVNIPDITGQCFVCEDRFCKICMFCKFSMDVTNSRGNPKM